MTVAGGNPTQPLPPDRHEPADAVAVARAAVSEGDRAAAQNDFVAARKAYLHALQALPNHSELLIKLGNICLRLQFPLPAERAFSAVLKEGDTKIYPPVFRAAFHGLLQANFLGGQHERNAEMLTRNLGSFEHNGTFLDTLALALAYTGNLRDLARFKGDFRRCQPAPGQLHQLGLALIRAGEPAVGLDILADVAKAQPGDPASIALLVSGLAASGTMTDLPAALDDLADRGGVDARSVFAHHQLARYLDIGDRLDALAREPDHAIHKDYNRPIPISTGRSRIVYGPAYDRPDPAQWAEPVIDPAVVGKSLAALGDMVRDLKEEGLFDVQLNNIAAVRARFAPEAGDPVQLLSTGRCGTRALYFFLRQMPAVLPFHSAQFVLLPVDRNHLLYRILTGELDRDAVADIALSYLKTRAAELVFAYRSGKTPVLVTHWDTVFGAVNAALFPDMRFVYLHRAPEPVFRSIFGKNQWQNGQLMHMLFDPLFPDGAFLARFRQDLEPEHRIAWYLHVTKVLAHGLQASLAPGRVAELKAESMFAGTEQAFDLLSDAIPGWSLDLSRFAAHFGEQRNTKDELLQVETPELDSRAARVPGLMELLENQGRF